MSCREEPRTQGHGSYTDWLLERPGGGAALGCATPAVVRPQLFAGGLWHGDLLGRLLLPPALLTPELMAVLPQGEAMGKRTGWGGQHKGTVSFST